MSPRRTEATKGSLGRCRESSHRFLEVNGSVSGVGAGQVPAFLDDAGEVDRGVAYGAVRKSVHKLPPYPLQADGLIRWMQPLVAA